MENDTGIYEKHCGGKLDEQLTREIKLAALGSSPVSAFSSSSSSSSSAFNHPLATQFCCLTEDGSQCKRVAGNASYSKRIQKTVQQKKLNLSIENSARHVYICDYHKNMIQNVRSCMIKRKRLDSGDEENGKDNNSNDGNKTLITLDNRGDRLSSINNNATTNTTTTTTITATTVTTSNTKNHQDTSLTITTFNSPSTSNSNNSFNNFSNSVKNTNTSITSIDPITTKSSSTNHISGSSNDKMTVITSKKDRKDNNGSNSSNGLESNCKIDNERVSSYTTGDGESTQVDLSTLQMNTLRRYKRHYRVQTPPGINKSQLADTLLNHFKEIPIDEKEAITYFIYMVKCNRNKIDQMKGLVTSSANNLPYSGSLSPRNS